MWDVMTPINIGNGASESVRESGASPTRTRPWPWPCLLLSSAAAATADLQTYTHTHTHMLIISTRVNLRYFKTDHLKSQIEDGMNEHHIYFTQTEDRHSKRLFTCH